MSRRLRQSLPGLAVVVLFALPLIPEIVGARVLVFRDAQITHWPWRRVANAALSAGQVPFVNAAASGGQPLLANPNAALLYPTFLLERVLPPAAAFNLHYLVHVLWAFFGARVLARRIGLGPGASFLAAVGYGFSGMMLSYGSAFMNSSAAAAWLPWCAAALVDLGRARGAPATARAGVAAGLALGLQLLAGEPAISLLTLAFGGAVLVAQAFGALHSGRIGRLVASLAAAAAAGLFALALAAPLLLPLRAVLALTYRGQHQFSERAFGAAAFSARRAIEWLLPRFGGNPDVLGGGANWLRSAAHPDVVYIWCVTLGVAPLLVLLLGTLRREFWDRRAALLAAGGLLTLGLSFGFSLPLYRFVFWIDALRRLRYPIKFYLLTSLCAALAAGLAAEALGRRRAGRRETIVLVAALALFGAAWAGAAPGGPLDRWAGPLAQASSSDPPAFLHVFRGLVRADALLGALVALCLALVLRSGARLRDPAGAFGMLAFVTIFAWGLPLFVSAPVKEVERPPALLRRVQGPGRLYVSTALPRFDTDTLRIREPGDLPRMSQVAGVVAEELVPLTGAPFGVRYLFETDPDGSYGYFNRLATEAAAASTPPQRDRLLALYGAQWVLAEEDEPHPLFRPVTGLAIAGHRLVLHENPWPVPELRWAGRAWRRRSPSATLELVRSDRFDTLRDVALPGAADGDAADGFAAASLDVPSVGADRATADIDAAEAGHVVFSRTFFPAWRARLDGREAPVLVANARDLAVMVPAGRHRVVFEYDRAPFRRGVALQAGAMLLAVAAAVATRRG